MRGAGSAACTCTRAQALRVEDGQDAADVCAIIVAGGSGERFGDPRGKQFVELLGIPLVAWSILAFDSAPSVRHVVVVSPQQRMSEMRDVLAGLELRNDVTLAPAGSTRQDSVLSGLMAVPADLSAGMVAIHDGARPLIEVDAIERCIATVRDAGRREGHDYHGARVDGAICASRVTDTLKLVGQDGAIVGSPDRSAYWGAQTPQVFRRATILAAHESALLEGFAGTDDASLVEHAGGRVCVVETSRDNIKVTMPEDLAIAEALLRMRMGIAF